MNKYLRIRNWGRWQSYRKDRGQPPWIKIHRQLMRDPNWIALSDAQRGQLVSMWLLAADHDGILPNTIGTPIQPNHNSDTTQHELISNSAETIKLLCFMKHKPNLEVFEKLGFIEFYDANTTPERRQPDAPEVETETETETETDNNIRKYAFERGAIRLNQKDFDRWTTAFTNLNLRAELEGLADWASKQKNWFVALSGALAKRDRQVALSKQEAAQKIAKGDRPARLGGGFA